MPPIVVEVELVVVDVEVVVDAVVGEDVVALRVVVVERRRIRNGFP